MRVATCSAESLMAALNTKLRTLHSRAPFTAIDAAHVMDLLENRAARTYALDPTRVVTAP